MTRSPEGSRSPLSAAELKRSTSLFEVKPGKFVSEQSLRTLLPDVETALFFGKAMQLNYDKLSELLRLRFKTDLMSALLSEGAEHSTELQDYLVEDVDIDDSSMGEIAFDDEIAPVDTELLAQLFEQIQVQVAKSIQDVAEKLAGVLDTMSSKYGEMTFQHMRKLNLQRNSIGRYSPTIKHQQVVPRLVILDVSGSMTSGTIHRIVDEVVGLAYSVEASLAIVSNTTTYWDPGTFTSRQVLHAAEFGGTQYETLARVLCRDYETVVTIADYDSSRDAKTYLRNNTTGHIGQVLDLSLVNRPTFLSECVGQLAEEVTPILIGNSGYVLR